MKPEFDAILITGDTGSGKSELLSAVLTDDRIAWLDPLKSRVENWFGPDPKDAKVVVVDHALDIDSKILNEIIVWCKWKGLVLWIAEQSSTELQSKSMRLLGNVFELNLVSCEEEVFTVITKNHVKATLKTGIELAQQLHRKSFTGQALLMSTLGVEPSDEVCDVVLANVSTRITLQPEC